MLLKYFRVGGGLEPGGGVLSLEWVCKLNYFSSGKVEKGV